MRDYGKVSPQFWVGKTGKALRGNPEAQIVAMYLMTCPTSEMTGVFHCPLMYIAYETGLGLEGASKGLQRLVELEFCTFEEDADTVFVHEMARYQIGVELKVNDNQVKSVKKAYACMPDGRIKQGFYERYKDAFHLGAEGIETAAFEAPSKPLRSQEQEQEQEQEQKQTTNPVGLVVTSQAADEREAPGKPACQHKAILALYHEILPTSPEIRDWTAARADVLRTRWNEDPRRQNLDYWRKFFTYVAESPFLTGKKTGKDGRAFTPGLEWILKAENFAKIREGRYHQEAA